MEKEKIKNSAWIYVVILFIVAVSVTWMRKSSENNARQAAWDRLQKNLSVQDSIADNSLSVDDMTTTTFKVENLFSLDIPGLMKPAINLHDEAIFQRQNKLHDLYLVIQKESKAALEKTLVENGLSSEYSANLANYAKLYIEYMIIEFSTTEVTPLEEIVIGHSPACTCTLISVSTGFPIEYTITFIDAGDVIIHITTWTKQSQENKYKELLKKIPFSFQLH